MKDNAAFAVEVEFAVPENCNIRADQIIQLTGVQAQTDCPGPLRSVASAMLRMARSSFPA
jgi:hypothetical protein